MCRESGPTCVGRHHWVVVAERDRKGSARSTAATTMSAAGSASASSMAGGKHGAAELLGSSNSTADIEAKKR